ncbi:uncharacterized protein [Miscanthus floridulus]|uniref:uncharacterized protein n=1 Tax=Miscanthus floridulus TaxID=154761 RepID=UPI0034599955
MDSRATESEILELENKLLHPTAGPISVPLYFLKLITRDFCIVQELGRGGYGVVYKLLGYCAESKGVMMKQPNRKVIVAEAQTRMLCFEYMCNGGLDKHLSDESSGLEWNMRYKIIKGICSGLKYLHGRNIIHLDLKPQNILMDATMVPKIADFSLSRFLSEQKSKTITSNCRGTTGYMAPEYIDRGIISKKADIFSLGVIIIEILKGCRDDYPDYRQSTETDFQHFREKVLSNWRNRFERSSKYTALELHTQQVKQCINIALECVHHEKEKRPNLSNIIEILNAAEGSYCVQNGEDLLVDHQIIHLGWEKDHLRGNTSYRNFGENQPSKRLQMQGNPVLLSELRPKGLEYVICVRISRMWEHRGTNEQNDIKHLDLVLVDEKANAIYAEIPPDAIPVCKPHLEKGKIVYVAKITVEKAKPTFKVVDHPYMIRLNKRTIIAVPNDQPDSFPKYTFSLTPFTSLLQYLKNENFLDVIGRIIAVSNAANVYLSSGDLMMRRLIKLQDLSGNTIDLSLVGKRALEFDGETVLKVGNYHFLSGNICGHSNKSLQGKLSFFKWHVSMSLVYQPQ